MSQPVTQKREERSTAARAEATGETRIDGAHPSASALPAATVQEPQRPVRSLPPGSEVGLDLSRFSESGSVVDAAEPCGPDAHGAEDPPGSPLPAQDGRAEAEAEAKATSEAISRQMELQAAQLAEHLRVRQKELDAREAELNSRAAQLERDARTARLWLSERMAELDGEGDPSASQAAAEAAQQEETRQRTAEALAVRKRELDEAEMCLEARQAEIMKLHQQVIDDRRRQEEEFAAKQRRLDTEHAERTAAVEENRRELAQRGEQLDQSRSALVQFRGELNEMHREALEIRLATEELWAELSGEAPPATLTRSLGRIRSQLADHYRVANNELQERKLEIERLREQLAGQHEKLIRQKSQFDAWVAACREEIEQQSSRLVARGEELEHREANLREQSRIWQVERLERDQEVRRLRRRLTTRAAMAAPIAP
jgi:hypothetical protein